MLRWSINGNIIALRQHGMLNQYFFGEKNDVQKEKKNPSTVDQTRSVWSPKKYQESSKKQTRISHLAITMNLTLDYENQPKCFLLSRNRNENWNSCENWRNVKFIICITSWFEIVEKEQSRVLLFYLSTLQFMSRKNLTIVDLTLLLRVLQWKR